MGKKSKRSRKSESEQAAPTATAARATYSTPSLEDETRVAPSLRTSNPEQAAEENLQCEDPYEDLYEDDEESYEDVYESSGDEGEYDEMAIDYDKLPAISDNDGSCLPSKITSWNPFQSHDKSNLEMDESAYKMHHALTPEWPSLSLDILPDRTLGDNRTRFPHVVTMVVGSQAEGGKNKLTVLRMSDLSRMAGREKTEKELDDEMLGEEWKHEDSDQDEEESSSSDEEEEELDPILEHYSFPHEGGINRIRVCPQNYDVVAAWSDVGVVSLYDVGGALDLLDRSLMGSNNNGGNKKEKNTSETIGNKASNFQVRKMKKDPFFVYSGHSTEGYAIDWSSVIPGRLATADCHGHIHIWNATHPVTSKDVASKSSSPWGNSSFEVKPTYSPSGDNIDNPSVEDLQWSPTEATVLASAECGGYVRIYDVRCPNRAMISNKIHGSGADVNVISWNRLVSNLLASGGDDGSFCVWDLRNFQTPDKSQSPKPLARFHCHKAPITSLEWHPTDESMIAVSDDNGTYIYDLSIEEDDPEHSSSREADEVDNGGVEGVIPPQLLFVHSGSEMTKEVHWHPQIPSCVATTSLSGFSVFIPSNL
ncbi:hypothetical protein HJC23_004069 [Cyclotella cryptica]|uniref:Histone-binding protein RBBP4-like N-terminal domain-containing protein n=1 Tax=Cyclotella cryptica TaxID=29204 RepID=A0ABD3PJZ1_9STRA|eukprot:CCRYP_014054-RA/>CCRYP_014054-RA protein AED:0.01 eAED:0.01 QI:121/1/1/1/1/1/2/109/592